MYSLFSFSFSLSFSLSVFYFSSSSLFLSLLNALTSPRSFLPSFLYPAPFLPMYLLPPSLHHLFLFLSRSSLLTPLQLLSSFTSSSSSSSSSSSFSSSSISRHHFLYSITIHLPVPHTLVLPRFSPQNKALPSPYLPCLSIFLHSSNSLPAPPRSAQPPLSSQTRTSKPVGVFSRLRAAH